MFKKIILFVTFKILYVLFKVGSVLYYHGYFKASFVICQITYLLIPKNELVLLHLCEECINLVKKELNY